MLLDVRIPRMSKITNFMVVTSSKESELQVAGRFMVARIRLTRMILNQAEKDANLANELETNIPWGQMTLILTL